MSVEMKRADIQRDKIREIVAKPHWEGSFDVDRLIAIVVSKQLTVLDLVKLDELLCGIASRAADQNIDEVLLQRIMRNWSVAHMRGARKALWTLFNSHPLLRELGSGPIDLASAA